MIYIIDDDKNVLRGYQILLRSAGLECCVFDNVEEFLCNWNKADDDILLLDINLPEIDGFDLLDYLEKGNLHLPVIVITAYDLPENRSRSEGYEVLSYLTKPVDSEILIELIRRQMNDPVNIGVNNN